MSSVWVSSPARSQVLTGPSLYGLLALVWRSLPRCCCRLGLRSPQQWPAGR